MSFSSLPQNSTRNVCAIQKSPRSGSPLDSVENTESIFDGNRISLHSPDSLLHQNRPKKKKKLFHYVAHVPMAEAQVSNKKLPNQSNLSK